MPRNDKYDDDEYVAKLLAEDAKKSSLRYASAGLSALLPRRPTGSAPKPNTRFLKNLVRDADNHNAALKKKEELEARMRLKGIGQRDQDIEITHRNDHDRKRRRLNNGHETSRRSTRDDHSRQDRSSSEHKRRRSRQKSDSRQHDDVYGERSSKREPADVDKSRPGQPELSIASSHSHSRDNLRRPLARHRSRSTNHDHILSDESSDNGRSRSSRRHDRRRHSPGSRRERDNRTKEGRRSRRSRSGSRNRSNERNRETNIPKSRSSANQTSSRLHRKSITPSGNSSSDLESDPLEDLVGPLPPSKNTTDIGSRVRGRGAIKHNNMSSESHSASNIDNHFSPSYNPREDHSFSDPDNQAPAQQIRQSGNLKHNDEDDWDMALEALRDRRQWQRKQSDRMRAAGWSDEELRKWERKSLDTSARQHGSETDLSQVKWIKRGEGREWDRGKEAHES